MTDRLVIALAQLHSIVGDLAGNAARVRRARAEAAAAAADIVLYPELFLSAYPPEDLVLKPAFQEACRRTVEELAAETADGGPALVLGTPWVDAGHLHNAVAFLANGRVETLRFKVDLPNYGVFDEKRVFTPGPLPGPVAFKGVRLGIPICEDIWGEEVVECLAETGAEILLVPNGSPYRKTADDERLNVVTQRVVESGLPLVYVNRVGGQDELVFDGASFGLNADRSLAYQMPAFEEAVAITVWERDDSGTFRCVDGPTATVEDDAASVYLACMTGLRDYVDGNRFPGVVLGLSGGIDSALVAALAVDALGPERVHCVMLPYRYTANSSLVDAEDCARRLGTRYDVVPIAAPVEGFEAALAPLLAGTNRDITEENLQSRTRGTILMALSNKFGGMVVTTGNKSEMSVGYATLYGDMNGGFNPIKDLYKMEVYALSRWRNANHPKGAKGPAGEVIPPSIIDKAPSAELRENQTDQDSLPPYPVLDGILERLVEEEKAVAAIVAEGFDLATVKRIEHLLYVAEYKRRQAAPGVKIGKRSFGRERRYPITNRFRDPGTPLPDRSGEAATIVRPRPDAMDF
jgi:NAD+ synthase